MWHWADAIEPGTWRNPGDLKATFASASFAGDLTGFNVGGNKCRIATEEEHGRALAYPPREESKPHEMAAFLLEHRGLKPSDLWSFVGSKGRVSEILSGKRPIGKEQAKKLVECFRVLADLFL
jgi:antitoxin component HigA of HigAB toxin-antitoxin module